MASREEIQHRVDVMQAWLDGEGIEHYCGNGGWRGVGDDCGFHFKYVKYRIKLKPREVFITEINGCRGKWHSSVDDAKKHLIPAAKVVKYVEVLDE